MYHHFRIWSLFFLFLLVYKCQSFCRSIHKKSGFPRPVTGSRQRATTHCFQRWVCIACNEGLDCDHPTCGCVFLFLRKWFVMPFLQKWQCTYFVTWYIYIYIYDAYCYFMNCYTDVYIIIMYYKCAAIARICAIYIYIYKMLDSARLQILNHSILMIIPSSIF